MLKFNSREVIKFNTEVVYKLTEYLFAKFTDTTLSIYDVAEDYTHADKYTITKSKLDPITREVIDIPNSSDDQITKTLITVALELIIRDDSSVNYVIAKPNDSSGLAQLDMLYMLTEGDREIVKFVGNNNIILEGVGAVC